MNISTLYYKFKNLFKNENSKEEIHKAIREIDLKQVKLKDSLTNLIFQESKLKEKRQDLMDEAFEVSRDLEEALQKNLDELSLGLIEKVDLLKDEEKFLTSQINELSKSIIEIKESKKELEIGARRYKDTLVTFNSKEKALNAHKEIRESISSIKKELNFDSQENTLSKIKDKIHLLNAQMSQMESVDSDFDKAIKKLRQKRVKKSQLDRLNKLKAQLNINENIIVMK